MEALDRIFEVLFARWRRKLGQSNLDAAWQRARFGVHFPLLFAITAGTLVLMVLVYQVTKTATFAQNRYWGQMLGAAVWLAISVLLDRRFHRFLRSPPELSPQEPAADRLLVLRFRSISIGIFVLTCMTGYLLIRAGLRLL